MINVLIPSGGKSNFFKESYYPKNLYEINGQPMIQRVYESLEIIKDSRFIFVFNQNECDKFHTDNIASLLTGGECKIVRLNGDTKGALCSCLMSIEYINSDSELLIVNSDQIIEEDLNKCLDCFREKNADCGVVCFDSIHPRWSYVRMRDDDVIEVAEKCPISKNAIAGFYYFKKGKDFVTSAMNAIRKDSVYDGKFYISSAVNEMILANKKVKMFHIDLELYKTFYTPENVVQYEKGKK